MGLPGCSLIYEPKGRAREYAALACNHYRGCGHGCLYCFAASATRKPRSVFTQPQPRAGDFIARLDKEAAKHQKAGTSAQIMLCFTCDAYQPLDTRLGTTRKVLEIFKSHGLHWIALTKGGTRALRDIDLFTDRDAFAATLTLLDPVKSAEWEPDAAAPQDRILALKLFHDEGVPTWASLEPVLDPEASLDIIAGYHEYIDLFKVGKLNYHPLARTIDWRSFGLRAIALLEELGYARNFDPDSVHTARPGNKQFYIKRDLARFLD